MSVIQTCSPAECAGQLLDAIGPDRFMRLHDAMSSAGVDEIGIALRTITDAIATHNRTHDRTKAQLEALRDFVQSIAATGLPNREGAFASAEPTNSAQ